MIKVNLAARKRSVNVTAPSRGGFGGFDLKDMLARVRSGEGLELLSENPQLKKALIQVGVFAVAYYAATYVIDDYKQGELAKVQAQSAELRNKLKLVNSELAKTSGFEKLKQDLEADERMIRTKIETIQKLVDDRTTPPKILIAVSKAVPKDVWLTNFELRGTTVSFRGQATGLDLVTDFIRALEETVYFKDVRMKSSSNVRDKGVDLSSFDLEATRR